jgi:hypothetical protein
MEDTAMKKRAYEKPTCRVVVLQHRTHLLQASPEHSTPPEEIPEYDDWMEANMMNGYEEDEEDW